MTPMPERLNVEINGLGGRLLNLLFPPRCANCKQTGSALCPQCFDRIKRLQPPFCERCSHPLVSAAAPCPECRAHPRRITCIRAAAWHEGVVRQAIHALKYNRRRDVAAPLAMLLAPVCAQFQPQPDFITSVPLHPERQRARGYNQAELLAEQTARRLRCTCVHVLERTRATADQIGLSAQERRGNVADAFRVSASRDLTAKRVVLIDDVCTTGATLDACADALFARGAAAVYGVTVARAHQANRTLPK
ncbi:MAG: hypothetical protein DCC52_11500 [Chloroflexi bacterium]|nr:MAG: hypothetical protein DCC52_11500 [Chloroflexota bacterium]